MANCQAKTQSGKPCAIPALKGTHYCFTHSPITRTAQAEARKRGGENRHTPHFADASELPADLQSVQEARKILMYTLREVIGMENSIARARVLLALFDSVVKSLEIGELEARLSTLEKVLNTNSKNLQDNFYP